MKNKFKIGLFLFLVLSQLVFDRYAYITKINPDCLYLILVYISIRSGMVKTVVSATLIGWIMDSLIGGIVGVFGFSRAIIAFFLNEFNRFLDLRKKVFVFLLIFVSLSISNLIANVFFHLIFGYDLELGMILRQPLLTAILGLLIITPARVREYLDVY